MVGLILPAIPLRRISVLRVSAMHACSVETQWLMNCYEFRPTDVDSLWLKQTLSSSPGRPSHFTSAANNSAERSGLAAGPARPEGVPLACRLNVNWASSSTVIVPRGIALTVSDRRVSAAIACAAR
jgi:hypothetical protein